MLAVLPLIAVLLVGRAAAQDRDQQWEWCRLVDERGEQRSGTAPDLAIGACTTLIQSGRETTQSLASAFNNRGNAYAQKGQHDRAIEDFDQALRLDSNYAFALQSRGAAYFNKGQYDRAIQDYDQPLRLAPSYAITYHSRALAHRYQSH